MIEAREEPKIEAEKQELPQQQAEQETQVKQYSSGSYRVGQDIPAGEYKLFSESNGYFCVYESLEKNDLDDILMNGNFTTCTYVVVSDGQLLEIRSAHAVAAAEAEPSTELKGDGVYKAGFDFPAGSYQVNAEKSNMGYYAVLNNVNATDTLDRIVNNNNFENNDFCTVGDGQYLELTRATASKTE
ncbi:hypothetical protein KPC83_05525 [Collinsella sp. zg1085]|uniref:hypothetical protein n=1 Tax=Collinsella sp. zg1085 TaxID=2844380 RepID=UPI001C0DDC5F|nr:hypothetical protein [Collinsella sp. zg1085]QWT17302.1 hypothetical protein KPC83_05525 [Collinsella sp. zg1085]